MANSVYESEKKILVYEEEIGALRRETQAMERDLQQDISSLTTRNCILRSLLEAISEHEGGTEAPQGGATEQLQETVPDINGSSLSEKSELEEDSVIAKHIYRLPQELQVGEIIY